MRTAIVAGLVAAILPLATAARADGVVSEVGRCQTMFVVSTPEGFAVAEWASGPVPVQGDTLVGNLAVTGRADRALGSGAAVGLLIESYGMNVVAATQMLKNQCGLNTGPFGIRLPAR